MNLLNKLSLRWKFMLAPVMGVVLMGLLAGLIFSATSRQEQALTRIQEDVLESTQALSKLATRLATNHTRVYELLSIAAEEGDEGRLYDLGKPLLNEVHSIEADARRVTRDMPSTELLLTALADYRKQVITAVEMTTVDLALAREFMTLATSQFNMANSLFLGLGEVMQQELESQINDYRLAREKTLHQFGVLFLVVILAVVIISLLISRFLSRDLQQSISILGKIATGEETETKENEVAQLAQVIEYVEHSHQRLDDAHRELSRQESLLRTILDNTLDGIITIDEKGIVEQFNAAAETVFGHSAGEAIGQNIAMLMPAPHSKQHDAYIASYLATGQAKVVGKTRNVEGLRKDGSLFPLEIAVNELWVEGQRKFTGIARDVSQRVAIEQELTRYRDSLEDLVKERTAALENSNRELESYSYTIAHDLRAPLRSIAGFSQILQEEVGHKLSAEEKEHFDRIVTASKRMAELIDDILELGRVTRSELQRTEVDLTALAKAAVERRCLAGENRKIDWQIQEGLTAVGDKNLLALLLDNLLGNACKYSSRKSHARIEFGSTVVEQDSKKSTAYYVRDNGVGFDMQYADKLYKPFHRLHNDDMFEGTGIGLASVQRIIHRHGGCIWAEAEVGEGATFYFTLPNA